MPKIIAIHSFRHGVGRSTLTANLGYMLAQAGQRVGLVAADTATSSLPNLFGVAEDALGGTFSDFLAGYCPLENVVVPINPHLANPPAGEMFFIPSQISLQSPELSAILERLSAGCQQLMTAFKLDTLLIDTLPGLSQESLIPLTLPDVLVVVLQHDWRDYQGTGVTIDVMRQLHVPRLVLIVNEAPGSFDVDALKAELLQTYQCEVVAVVPYTDEMMALANRTIFAVQYPQHPLTALLRQTALNLAG